MEGNLRQIAIWLGSVTLIVVAMVGIRIIVLKSNNSGRTVASQPIVQASPPFGNPPKQWGVHMNPSVLSDLDDEFDPVKVDAMISLLKDLGVNAVAIPYAALNSTEPIDAVNDVMVDKLSKAGFTIILLCCDGFEFGTDNRYQTAYTFAQRLGEKYRNHVTYYQFLNEISGTAIKPGHSGFTFDDYNLEKYAEIRELLRGLTDGLASVHPRAQRLLSAHWLGIGIIDQLIKDRVSFEIVAWHWFADMGPDPVTISLSVSRGVPPEFDGQIFNLPAHFTEQGKEFWITETNLPDGSLNGKEREQADYLAHMLQVVKATDEITGLFFYRLTDGSENVGTSAWGLYNVRPTGDGRSIEFAGPKEAYRVYKDFLTSERQTLPLPFDLTPPNR